MNVLIFLLCSVVILFILAVCLITHSYKKDAEEERKQYEKKLKEREEELEKEKIEWEKDYNKLIDLYGTPTHELILNNGVYAKGVVYPKHTFNKLFVFGEASIIYIDNRAIPFKDIISYNIEHFYEADAHLLTINIRDLANPLISECLDWDSSGKKINAILAYIVDQNNKK